MMRLKLFILSIFLFLMSGISAQETPTQIKYTIMDIKALRFYPFKEKADTLIQQVIEKKQTSQSRLPHFMQYDVYEKTVIDAISNKELAEAHLTNAENPTNVFSKYIIRPYRSWADYARPLSGNSRDIVLTTALYEDYQTVYQDNQAARKGTVRHASRREGLYESIGKKNVASFLDEILNDIDLFRNDNAILLLPFKSPLSKDGLTNYQFFLVGKTQLDGEPCYEIAFYPNDLDSNAFTGYLYVSCDGNYTLKKALFSLNNAAQMNFVRDYLVTQNYDAVNGVSIPRKQKTVFLMGDDVKASLWVARETHYGNYTYPDFLENRFLKNHTEKDFATKDASYWEAHRLTPLSASQQEVENLVKQAEETPAYKNTQNALIAFMTNHLPIGGVDGKVEIGPISQMISYNGMEGVRLKLGANTTMNLHNQWLVGGYLAYGTDDKLFKYRGDVSFSSRPRDKYIWETPNRLISLSYVRDMNIPGEDLLTSNRDRFIYSFSHLGTNNMSMQKLLNIFYKHEYPRSISFKIGGRYLEDKPMGAVQYIREENGEQHIISNITTSEINFSLRYSPRERFIQNRDERMYLRRGDIELNLNHRIGIKGAFGSDYNYQITDFSAYKKFHFPKNVGELDVLFTAGKVWSQVPFPLLFIPKGNQSYVFEDDGYNLMNFYEFTTDNYISGNLNFMFNWSPFNLFWAKSKIKTSLGGRMLYGSLSDKNNPALHPELFIFNQGVQALGSDPYTEVNIGFSNILKILRIEYVRRLTYRDVDVDAEGRKINKGSIFVTADFSF